MTTSKVLSLDRMLPWALAALLAALLAQQTAAQSTGTSFYGWATPYGGRASGHDANVASYGLVNGACGYGALNRSSWPFWAAAAIPRSSPIASSGLAGKDGCGACIRITCTQNCPASASPVVALVTDACESCGTEQVNPHALIYEQHLSQGYQVDVRVEQVACEPPGNIVVRVTGGHQDPNYIRLVLLDVAGLQPIQYVHIKPSAESGWTSMHNQYGAAWQADSLGPPPYDVRITPQNTAALVAMRAVPSLALGDYPTGVQPAPAASAPAPAASPAAPAATPAPPATPAAPAVPAAPASSPGSSQPGLALRAPGSAQLEESVVNRIAAGEVIQRPVNALKELVENSLDAGATQVNIVVKEGGNKMLQIQDNGLGVQKEDLPLLCERHATSKLRDFRDLEGIATLGFRGEALASISFVAHLTVTTMTRGATHGHRVTYRDGRMDPAGPVPCAAVQGTTLVVEDLFYNMLTRKKALKGASDEYARVLDMVGRHAVYKAGTGFSVKKQGEARPDIHTVQGASRLDNIRAIYGASVARALLQLAVRAGGFGASPAPDGEGALASAPARASGVLGLDLDGAAQGGCGTDDGPQFIAEGYVSSADYSGKRAVLVLFINGRPVDCAPLKRALEATYASVLPKAAKPFVFLDLRLPGSHVDVNVHPTKREVGFLHQDALIARLCQATEALLLSSNSQRTFTQTLLPSAPLALSPDRALARAAAGGDEVGANGSGSDGEGDLGEGPPRPPPVLTTRRDKAGGDRKLGADAVNSAAAGAAADNGLEDMGPVDAGFLEALEGLGSGEGGGDGVWSGGRSVRPRLAPPACKLDSILELVAEVDQGVHRGLTEMIRGHTFVGMADDTLALVQGGTRLFLLDVTALSRDLFYQQTLRRWERLPAIRLEDAPRVADLARAALSAPDLYGDPLEEDSAASAEEVISLVERLLIAKAPMLAEYLSFGVDEGGRLTALPQLVNGHVPDLARLPGFVLSLARDVDWAEEKPCFRTLAEALSDFYCIQPPLFTDPDPDPCPSPGGTLAGAHADRSDREWMLEHVVFPAMRNGYKPPRSRATDGTIVELTRLEKLYKVFERC
ncbi:hypothetical protein WJX81_004838 [Elliptochloris bilobata]|uniref:Uncharacterized protein n=1 Tax=Elliptochloris bilobata TaxID=381761 RepID=A0AAW1QHN5_9CHLO